MAIWRNTNNEGMLYWIKLMLWEKSFHKLLKNISKNKMDLIV